MSVEYSILKRAKPEPSAPVLFSVVRNEMYFLPHFLRHYRALGVRVFLFLDDRSEDGTLEFLLAQPDCSVLQASLRFGEPYGKKRFGIAAKTLVPREFLQGRWVLSVDADEFLLLPRAFADIGSLAGALEREGLKIARALMFDFFPQTLRALEGASAQSGPFALCPFFDAWRIVDWPHLATHPRKMTTENGVRPRMFVHLYDSSAEIRALRPSYRMATMYKAPLLLWGPDTEMLSAHHSNQRASDRIQLGLAHFKFMPGYRQRIEEAVASKAYWQESIEYRFLKIASRELQDWPLPGSRSRRFESVKSLEETGLVFSRLGPGGD